MTNALLPHETRRLLRHRWYGALAVALGIDPPANALPYWSAQTREGVLFISTFFPSAHDTAPASLSLRIRESSWTTLGHIAVRREDGPALPILLRAIFALFRREPRFYEGALLAFSRSDILYYWGRDMSDHVLVPSGAHQLLLAVTPTQRTILLLEEYRLCLLYRDATPTADPHVLLRQCFDQVHDAAPPPPPPPPAPRPLQYRCKWYNPLRTAPTISAEAHAVLRLFGLYWSAAAQTLTVLEHD